MNRASLIEPVLQGVIFTQISRKIALKTSLSVDKMIAALLVSLLTVTFKRLDYLCTELVLVTWKSNIT